MSTVAAQVLDQIKALPPDDLREVCREVISLAGHLDHGELSDETLTSLAAETFSLLDQEEANAQPR